MCDGTDTAPPSTDAAAAPKRKWLSKFSSPGPATDAQKWFRVAMIFAAFSFMILIAEIITISVAAKSQNDNKSTSSSMGSSLPSSGSGFVTMTPPSGENPCAGMKPDFPNVECVIDEINQTGEQAGANVTKGYNGDFNTTAVPITEPYWKVGLCPVNVHWHLGAEHYSVGQFDENGSGPTEIDTRRKLAGKVRQGFQCSYYDDSNPAFTSEYEWKHCVGMEVGQTYEVHWPHSAVGACGTLNQYQTPFYDGVFCNIDQLTDTAGQIGVQGQVFTIINDDRYYYPDLMHGMIVDGDMGMDLAMYTGSTTGTSRDNEICSQYAPITWQVDRKCHLVSASTFDKMCADMMAQRDDMSDDLYAHGSRPLVADHLAANNHANLRA